MDVNTLNIYSTFTQVRIKRQSHKSLKDVLPVDTSLYDVSIGSSKHVQRVPPKGALEGQHHWLSISIMEVISERQWPLAFSDFVSCSSCGCHTKWPPPTHLFRRLITPGYRSRSNSLEPAIQCHFWMKWNSPIYTDLNLTIPHEYTLNYVSVRLTQPVICHLLNHHINRKKNKNRTIKEK